MGRGGSRDKMEEKTVVILGATGSIGTQTLDVLKKLKGFKLVGFTYHKNEELAEKIAKEFPGTAFVSTVEGLQAVEKFLESTRPDIVVLAVPGFSGFLLSMMTVSYTKRLALANKESMVCGGRFLKEKAKREGVEIIPVDSEHSAVFQLMEEGIVKIAITASGGALRDWKLEDLEKAKPEDVLKHPVWSMGSRITVDSATMVNKAFEVLEAMELFDLRRDQIDVYIHRQGLVHGMVFLKDGTVKVHVSKPDMRIPIALAMTYPERLYEHLEFPDLETLSFERPDREKYPLFFLVDEIYDSYAKRTAFNASDELAVQAFLDSRIGYLEIFRVVEGVVKRFDGSSVRDVQDLVEIDKAARRMAWEKIERSSR